MRLERSPASIIRSSSRALVVYATLAAYREAGASKDPGLALANDVPRRGRSCP